MKVTLKPRSKCTKQAICTYVNGGKDEMRNTLLHVHQVKQADYKRMADHNIYVTSGMTKLPNTFEDAKNFLLASP